MALRIDEHVSRKIVTHDGNVLLTGEATANAAQVRAYIDGACRMDIATAGVDAGKWSLTVDGSRLGAPGPKRIELESLDAKASTLARSSLDLVLEAYDEVVPIPADINPGLSRALQSTMVATFGKPCVLSDDCLAVTNPALSARMVTRNVGPFSVSGLDTAVEALKRLFARVKAERPALYATIGTAGMLCCRRVRGSAGQPPSKNFSNHSWGTAVDLTIAGRLDQRGDGKCQRGLIEVAPYFNAEGFYWGAGFSGSSEDAMHFEAADETVRSWQ